MEIGRVLVAASKISFVCLSICFLFKLKLCVPQRLFSSLKVLSHAANNCFSKHKNVAKSGF